jgi:hypothetical protein
MNEVNVSFLVNLLTISGCLSTPMDDALAPDPPGPPAGPWPCALRRRVLALMAHNIDVPLALSNLRRAGRRSAHRHMCTSRATCRWPARA